MQHYIRFLYRDSYLERFHPSQTKEATVFQKINILQTRRKYLVAAFGFLSNNFVTRVYI